VTTVNRHNSSRAPLLFLANGKDHTVPAVSTRAAYNIQKKTGTLTKIKEYHDRSHCTFSQDGWKRWRTIRSTGRCARRGPNSPRMLQRS
jgi:non-heme chloroperoxidase